MTRFQRPMQITNKNLRAFFVNITQFQIKLAYYYISIFHITVQ